MSSVEIPDDLPLSSTQEWIDEMEKKGHTVEGCMSCGEWSCTCGGGAYVAEKEENE